MGDLALSVKIKADVAEFAGGLNAAETGLSNFAGETKKNTNSAGKSVQQLGKAYETLGIKSIRSVGKEVLRLRSAYQRLADSGNLSKNELLRAKGALKTEISKLEKQVRITTPVVERLSTGLGRLAVGASLIAGVSKLVNVARSFDVINASLVTVTGSEEAAATAFAGIKEFAATTPFDLEQVASSFIKMKALGLDPSKDALTAYGNTASAMGKDLNQMIEAVADASTGEFERLKEFGIKSKSQGDNVTFTFQGIKTTVGKNAAEIEGYLKGIGNINFAGAMEKRSATLDGAISNLGDSWDNLFLSMSQNGSGDMIETGVRGISSALKVAADNTDTLTRAALLGATAWGTYYLATKAATRGNVGFAKGIPLAGAALAGWQIGSYLSDEFSVVRQAGIAMAAGLANVWEYVKFGVKAMGAGIVAAYQGFINTIKESFGGMVVMVSKGMKSLGMAGDTTANMDSFVLSLKLGGDAAGDLTKKLSELRAERDKNTKQNDAVYGQMFVEADKPKAASNVIQADFGNNPQAVIKSGETDKQKEARLLNEQKATDNIINLAQAKFDRLANMEVTAIMGEEDRVNQKYAAKLLALQAERDLLDEHHVLTGAQQALFNDAEKAITKQQTADLAAIRKRVADKEASDKKKIDDLKLKGEATFWSDTMSLTSSKSKDLFNIGKAAKLAQATLSGFTAATLAWEVGMLTGPWTAAAYTAASLAKTGTLISSIESTSFGGGSATPSAAGGGTPSANEPSSTDTANQPQAQTPQPIILNVKVDAFNSQNISYEIKQDLAQALTPAVAEQMGDGFAMQVAA